MLDTDLFSAYLQLAEKVFKREVKLNGLSMHIRTLPPLDRESLDWLAEVSEKVSLSQPRMSWTICYVAEKASRQQELDLFTRSLAAWYLGRAANHWVQPQLIAKAISRARRGFEKLGDPGWIAACDWMANDITWTRPNFIETEETLTTALQVLEDNGFREYAYLCRLALSYSQILLNKYSDAETNIEACEDWFVARGDQINQARCWRNKAVSFRRRYIYHEAIKYLTRAESVFIEGSSLSDLAITYTIRGLVEFYSSTNVEETINWYQKSIRIFESLEMSIWLAYNSLNCGLVFMQVGQLNNAENHFSQAVKLFEKNLTSSLLADAYMSIGKLDLYQGKIRKAILDLEKAKKIHISVGMEFISAVDSLSIAEAMIILGRYQESIVLLEKISSQFHKYDNSVQLGFCELQLSQLSLILRDYKNALLHSEKAAKCLQITNQLDSTISILLISAKINFELGNVGLSKSIIGNTLNISETNMLFPQLALSRKIYGEILINLEEFNEASFVLAQALEYFSKMKFIVEECACLISLGRLNQNKADYSEATKFYKRELSLSLGIYPEHDWHAYAGLAEMQDSVEAISYYHQAVNSLNKIRESFWQPDLAGSYSETPGQIVSKAVKLAYTLGLPDEVLFFIEADKAVSLQQQFNLTRQSIHDPISGKLAEDKVEIRWIKQQIQSISTSNTTLQVDPRLQELQTRLKIKKAQCDGLMAQLDRKQTRIITDFQHREFSLKICRQILMDHIGSNWLAVNYYQLEDQFVIVIITPDASQTLTIPLTPRLKKSLRICKQSHQNNALPSESDLHILGKHLIPFEVMNHLSPETTLLIFPHKSLHGIPWAAIGEKPLVTHCLPVIAPSVKSLVLIWEHNCRNESNLPRKGLLAGTSHFEGRHPDLPAVEEELTTLESIDKHKIKRAAINTATLEELKQSLGESEERPFDCLHISTHIFSDPESGRLNGLALKNEDIFVDQLRDLAPMPLLVTFSGCNSIFGQIYPGDEQISLPNTCFLAGAANVIGSVWPVVDHSTLPIMSRFYSHYLAGMTPAQALALSQRESIHAGEELRSWAGFCCLGVP